MPPARSHRARRVARVASTLLLLAACGEPAPEAPPEAGPVAAAAPSAEVDALRTQLERERARVAELEAQLAFTQEQLSRLAEAARSDAPAGPAAPRREVPGVVEEDAFDAGRLAALDVAPHRIERLQRAAEAAELQQLELSHEARRDGWLGSKRYRTERGRLDAAVRRELGDDDYDLLLCATGRNNRVVVSSVMAGSAAEAAGLRPGDQIVGYDDRRIFFGSELQRRVARSEDGRNIPLDLQRGDDAVRVGLPGGPLGVRMTARRECRKQVR